MLDTMSRLRAAWRGSCASRLALAALASSLGLLLAIPARGNDVYEEPSWWDGFATGASARYDVTVRAGGAVRTFELVRRLEGRDGGELTVLEEDSLGRSDRRGVEALPDAATGLEALGYEARGEERVAVADYRFACRIFERQRTTPAEGPEWAAFVERRRVWTSAEAEVAGGVLRIERRVEAVSDYGRAEVLASESMRVIALDEQVEALGTTLACDVQERSFEDRASRVREVLWVSHEVPGGRVRREVVREVLDEFRGAALSREERVEVLSSISVEGGSR